MHIICPTITSYLLQITSLNSIPISHEQTTLILLLLKYITAMELLKYYSYYYYIIFGFLFLQTTLILTTTTILQNQSDHPTVTTTIQSEDGDAIDCIDMYKQPALDHPCLKHHKIQLNPTRNQKLEDVKMHLETNTHSSSTVTTQIWHKSGRRCPKGTIPIRRMKNTNLSNTKKQPTLINENMPPPFNLLHNNYSMAILHAEGYAYFGAKGDIRVWNPNVEFDDEYSTSRVALKNGPQNSFQSIESGWVVNPRLYGDRQTRFFVYWTKDGSNETGCFDLTCPGFIQTSNEIALGAAIYPISKPNGLPYQITIFIHKDAATNNWWLQYGETTNIGYWPGELMDMLKHNAETAQWGGEVYSSRVGRVKPHTRTGMGSGAFADFMFGRSGSVKRIRELRGNGEIAIPEWAMAYTDEYRCYDVMYLHDYVDDPEFYYGGPGRNPLCP